MFAFLKMLNPIDWLLVAFIVAMIGFAGYEGVRVHRQHDQLLEAQAGQAKAEKALADLKAEYSAAAAKAETDARTEEARRTEAAKKVIQDAHTQVAEAERTARDASDAAGRLQQRVAALIAASRRPASDPGAGGRSSGEQSPDALDLLAGLLDRMGPSGGQLAAYANKLKIAGSACERRYDTLTP